MAGKTGGTAREESTTITIRRATRDRVASKKITDGQSFDEAVNLLIDAFEAHVGKDARLLPAGGS